MYRPGKRYSFGQSDLEGAIYIIIVFNLRSYFIIVNYSTSIYQPLLGVTCVEHSKGINKSYSNKPSNKHLKQ